MRTFNVTLTLHPWTLVVPLAVCCLILAGGCRAPEVQRTDMHGQRVLDHAVREGDVQRVEALIQEGAQINVPDADGVLPLHRAARNGDLDMVKLLLSYRADPRLPTKDGWNAVLLAAWYGHPQTVGLLLANGAVPGSTSPQGWSMLHMAAIKNMPTLVDTVLQNWTSGDKPDINARDKSGRTPLMLAIQHESTEAITTLMLKGADAKLGGPGGESPLIMAIRAGDVGMVMPILNSGITPTRAAVDLATELGKTDLAQLLWQRLKP